MDWSLFLEVNPWIYNIFNSLLVILIGILTYIVISNIIIKKIEEKLLKTFKSKKTDTYFRLFRSINRYLFILIILFILLKINGVNISSMLTGVGIVGIIFMFAIQDALKDIIKGFDIIADSYYKVGDVVRIDKYTGLVIAIGIKTTKLEDIYEKNIVSLSNRNIEKVEVLSHMINIDIPLPYELKTKKAEETIDEIVKIISKLKHVEKVEYRGINEFAESNVKYHIKVYCTPKEKVQTRRDALTTIFKYLEEKNIKIPFNQIDIHQK